MKKTSSSELNDDLRPHYDFDFKKMKPNRFASGTEAGRVVGVVLDPDVAEVFHSSEDVNNFLRSAITAMPTRQVKKTARKRAG
ncbi:MAG TPA: hypothetical protein VHL58_05795 [Thermoanaerobaculia bacterium]|nr:hypothetical protein [Thermoanaerobaculia bacterium]